MDEDSPFCKMESMLCLQELIENHKHLFVDPPRDLTLVSKSPEVPLWTQQKEKTEAIQNRLERDLPKISDLLQSVSSDLDAAAKAETKEAVSDIIRFVSQLL